MRRRSRTIAIVFLFGLRVLCQPDVVFAQVPGIFPQRQFEAPVQAMRDNVQQRQLQQALSEITEALEGNNWVQAASLFDSAWSRICSGEDPILEENSTDGQPIVREGTRTDAGGRSRMEDVYQTAPAEFRKEYLTQFSSVANQALTDATVHGGPPALRQVAARYRFTNAGAVATRQLARLAIERADYLDAALQLDLLKRMSAGESQPGGQQTLQIQLAVAQWMAGLEFDAISELKTLASTSDDQPVRMAFAGKDILLPPVDGDYRGLLERISAGRISSRPRPSAAETSWLQPGGDYRRSAIQSTGPIDLKPRWTASLSEVADVLFADRVNPLLGRVREYIDQFVVRFQQGNATVPPNSLPLLADDLLVFRTMAGLRAVDVTTGELIWESSLPDGRIRAAMDRLQETSEVAGEEITPTPRSLFVPNASRFESSDSTIESMAGGLAFQLFSQMVRTNTATQLSSDGSTVYAIEDSGWLTWPGQLDFDGTSGETQTNYLRAYDLKSGVRRWEAGGQAAGSGRANVLAGYYFLGAPLVLGSRIYVIAENSEGIFLLQLGEPEFQSSSPASANPRIIRSQLLTIPEFPLTRHPVRKHAGMTPSFAQGLLICPTTDQQVIAVSVADHSIRWVYRYQDIIRMPELGYQVPVLAGSLSPQHSDQLDFDSRWTDTLPRIHGDTVVLTPRDDDKMYCLDLQTGRELWRTGRGLVRSVVAITDDLIIATGNRVVMGIARNTGKLVWVQEIHDAVVSGIASTDGSVVHVPTTSPSIISYEISTGRRLLTRRLRSSQPVGNLLVRKDRIIDQTLTSVRCFSSDPADADAPLLEAQAALLDGDFEKGIQILDQLVLQFESNQALTTEDAESVRRAKVTAQSAQTVLTDVLMESLRVDFIRNRQHIPRLRQLIQQTSIDQVQAMSVLATMLNMDLTDAAVLPDQLKDLDKAGSQMDQLFELMVDGLLEMKERPVSELVDAVAELLPELRSGSNHVYVQGYLTRQNSQVLAAGIKRVLMSRTEQDRHIIEARLVERTKQILDQSALSTTETLQMIRDCDASGLHAVARQLLDSLDSSPADPVVFAAVNATREQMNLRSITTGNGEAARALVDLLQTWNQNGNFSALGALIADLKSADGFNNNAALKFHAHQEAQVTFDQWVTQHSLPGSPSIWPPGTDGVPKVVASDERSMLPQPSPVLDGPQLMIPIFGAPGIYRGCSLFQEANSTEVKAVNADGQLLWSFSPGKTLPTGMHQISDCYAMVTGHIVVLKTFEQMFVLDTSSPDPEISPQVLWQLDLSDLTDSQGNSLTRQFVPGWQRIVSYSPQPSGMYPAGPVTPEALPVISGRQLVVFDTVTGKQKWQLSRIAPDSRLMSNNDSLLILSEGERRIEHRSLTDGQLHGVSPIPDWWMDANENVGSSVRDVDQEPGQNLYWRIAVIQDCCIVFRQGFTSASIQCRQMLTDELVWEVSLPQDSVFSNISEDMMAVICEGKTLKLLRVDTGTELASIDVTAVPEPRNLYLRPYRDQLVVLPEAVEDPSLDLDPVSEGLHVFGRMYAINRNGFQLAWDEPLGHYFLRSLKAMPGPILPSGPVMVLLARASQLREDGFARVSVYSAKVVDVRTGKDVDLGPEASNVGRALNYHWMKIFASEKRVELSFENRFFTLDYSREANSDASTQTE